MGEHVARTPIDQHVALQFACPPTENDDERYVRVALHQRQQVLPGSIRMQTDEHIDLGGRHRAPSEYESASRQVPPNRAAGGDCDSYLLCVYRRLECRSAVRLDRGVRSHLARACRWCRRGGLELARDALAGRAIARTRRRRGEERHAAGTRGGATRGSEGGAGR